MPKANSKKLAAVLAVAITALATHAALAQTLTPRQSIEARQSHFKDMGGAFKTVRDQLRRPTPDMTAIQQAAQSVKELAQDQPNWFPKGSGAEAGVKTAAKPEVWNDSANFSAAMQKLREAAVKLDSLAQAKDIDGLKAHVPAVGQACKGCHDKYRVPEEE
jgi:cytochrome c556